ncbi:AvrD family protein [Arthrobacter sp. R4-81]
MRPVRGLWGQEGGRTLGAAASSMLLEDALGPSEGRYFGAGYRNVRHVVSEEPLVSPGNGENKWRGEVAYPLNWSLNADGTERAPHLSSVDAVVLPLLAVERQYQDASMASLMPHRWVRKLELRGGRVPWTDLARVPLSFSALPTLRFQESTEMQATVGNMRVRIELVKGRCSNTNLTPTPTVAFPRSVYAGGYWPTDSRSVITNFSSDSRAIESEHELLHTHVTSAAPQGLGTQYWPAPTAIEYLVTMGQLTQALVYRVCETNRATVGNLWMRTLRISMPFQPTANSLRYRARTSIEQDSEITIGHTRLRTLRVTSRTSDGVQAEASLAFVCGAATDIGER